MELDAWAYTEGLDIHVGPGQEKHLPHEGWHVVQQLQGRVRPTSRVSGKSVNGEAALEREATVMGARARSSGGGAAAGPEVAEMETAGNHPAALQAEPIALVQMASPAVERIIAAALPSTGTTHSADMWTYIRAQVAEPRARPRARRRAGHPLAPLLAELYSSEMVADLEGMSPEDRRAALSEMFRRLTPNPAAPGAGGVPPTVEEDAASEASLVDRQISSNAEGGWRGVREGILSAFGVFEVGVRAAIEGANLYYRQLVRSRLFGRVGSLVHVVMQAALDRASAVLAGVQGAERGEIETSIGTPGGFYIRPNANNRWVLSLHSFGWAIDLTPTINPNVGSSHALEAVAAVTGRSDPRQAETEGLRSPDAARVAEELRTTSRAYVDAMRDDASIGAALLAIANRARSAAGLTELEIGGAEILAAAESGAGRWLRQVVAIVAAGAPGRPAAGLVAASQSILSAVRAYRRSFGRGGRRVAAAVGATPGSVAAHGFLSLSPRLVGALTGTDGGNLNWLGTSSVADYMHFELPAAARRGLLTNPPSNPTAAGEPHPGSGGEPGRP
jgi:hypothetical protein